MKSLNHFSNEIEQNYSNETDVQYRRSQGQFFTPFPIAKFMSEWLLANRKPEFKILDPAAGFGVFERAIVEIAKDYHQKINFDLWEKDKKIGESLKKITVELDINAQVHENDFLVSSWDKLYDGIVANPPYYKHHHIENKQGVLQDICLKTSFQFSIQTNIYCWFLIKCLNLLEKNGRLAFIIPSEFLNSNYGIKVKSYLINCRKVRHLLSIHFSENVFDNALTTSLIVFAENNEAGSDTINLFNVQNIEDIKQLEPFINKHKHKTFRLSELNPEVKWRNYFNGEKAECGKKFIQFKEFGRFSRGIATGSNAYFTLSKSESKRYSLPQKSLIPCITKANFVKDIIFKDQDFRQLVESDKKTYLFNGEASSEQSVREYIKKGEIGEINKAFLTKIRNPWYALEKRDKSYIWCSVFGRKGLKFIWNETNCVNLTCFHAYYPTNIGENFLDIIFIYLNTSFAMKMFEFEKREYGNGLEKFEPNDINKSMMLDFRLFSESQISELKILQSSFLKADVSDREQIIKKVDIILEEFARMP